MGRRDKWALNLGGDTSINPRNTSANPNCTSTNPSYTTANPINTSTNASTFPRNASSYPRNITNISSISVVQIQVGIVQVWCSRWGGGASEHLIWVELLWWLDWTDPNLDHPLYPTWNEGKFLKEGWYKKWQIHGKIFNMKELQCSLEWTDHQKIVASLQTWTLLKKIHNRCLGQKARKLQLFCSFLNCIKNLHHRWSRQISTWIMAMTKLPS